LRAQIRDIEREQTELVERAEAFKAGAGQETPELAQARKHLMDTEFALRDMQPRVAAAYRAAAETTGAPTVAPPPPEVAAPPVESPVAPAGAPAGAPPAAAATQRPGPVDEQRALIAKDVTEKMIKAGRPPEEAEAAGQLVAARYVSRAARFRGALGGARSLQA
jgi:hypothetical protein